MFSLTQRSMPEAKLPKAAWHACVRPNAVLEGLQAGRLPGVALKGGPGCQSHRRTNSGAVASSLGTSDCAVIIRAERPYQLPEALP
jgi:hypothetical protein